MRRHITTALATCTLALGLHGAAVAVTDGPTCKAECAPRIDEQCGSLQGKAQKKCRRKLVRACKATDPVVACTTTDDMTRALADRLLHVAAADDGADAFDLTLCAAGSFLRDATSGAWSVRILDGALVLELDVDRAATQRLAVQRNAAGTIRLDGRRAVAEDEGGACSNQPARPRPGDDDPTPGQGSGDPATDDVSAALGDKILTVSSDSFFSSGTIVQTQEMGLCASGSFHLVVTTVTSTTIGDFSDTVDSEDVFDGTWSVRQIDGVQTLELVTGEPEPRRFAVEVVNGQILLDGKAPDVSPNTACGSSASGQPGQPGDGNGGQGDDPVAQLAATLTNQVVVLEESNAGFGTETTSFALCSSGRYLLDFETSAAPGRVREEIGNWSIRLQQDQPVLVLAADDGGGEVFAITTDAQDNILLNGLLAQSGSADAIAAICPGL